MNHVPFDLTKVRVIWLRHAYVPPPRGCRWCGVMERGHGQRWTPGRKVHIWEEPTREQRFARMWAQRRRRK